MVTCLPYTRKLWNSSCLTKGQRDGTPSSSESSGPTSREGMAWHGPRTVVLRRNATQGFGFTLRHFIVYPPESTRHAVKDEENMNGEGYLHSDLEPMDTIFVKSVREKGPAHQAGLSKGDRLVKVNGESVLGKSYAQVVTLIQNCEGILELSIMPKDEDVLQLAYSQDAYLSGGNLYTREEYNQQKHPSVSYPATRPQQSMGHNQVDGWGATHVTCSLEQHSGMGGLVDYKGLDVGAVRTHQSPGLYLEDLQFGKRTKGQAWEYSSSGGKRSSPLHGQYAAFQVPSRKGSYPWVNPPQQAISKSERCQQALADWYYSQLPERAPSMLPRYRSFSQDRLGEVGPSAQHHRMGWPHSASQDTLLLRSDLGLRGERSTPYGPSSSRAHSESILVSKCDQYGHSLETLEQTGTLVSPRFQRAPWFQHALHRTEGYQVSGNSPIPVASALSCHSHMHQQPPRQPPLQTADEAPQGYRSYSPSFNRKAARLMQTRSFRDLPYSNSQPTWIAPSNASLPESVIPSVPSLPPHASYPTNHERHEVEQLMPQSQDGVVWQKPPTGRRIPHAVFHPTCGLSKEAAETLAYRDEPRDAGEPHHGGSPHHTNGRVAPLAAEDEPLASIPFIDESSSPTAEMRPCMVPASSVVSSTVNSSPAVITSPASPSCILTQSRLVSHNCRNVPFSRRSSYLLAITTERSKSCDEGLNIFRDESRMFSRLPKRVKSFFTDGSLDSLGSFENTRSKRHSTSELGIITFSDVRKEGWLQYKQIVTEKGKKVGSSMRPWKRVFCVLRLQSLYLYKDKREAVLHGASLAGCSEDEQTIDICDCLVDIAYSETKRKHALRLTTQDFCEYLLQAEDREDMLNWIKVIRENSRSNSEECGFSGQALINKKLNDYRKQSLTGNKQDSSARVPRIMPPFIMAKIDNVVGAPRTAKLDGKEESSVAKTPWGNIMKKTKKVTGAPKAFGARLEDCQPAISNKLIPLVVEICCRLVEEMGLDYTGIYRVPGNNAMVSSLQEQLNKGMDINPTEEKWQDLNVVSSLLKSFFRKLPEPLFTNEMYNSFIDANRMESPGDRLKTMKKLIHGLPDYYYHTLKFLIGHLKTVASHSEKNKMEPRNLALVFGPTLVRTSDDNMTDMVTHMPDRYKIVETLIQHCDWFFSEETEKDEKTPEDKEDLQPVPNIDHLLSNIGKTGPIGEVSDSNNIDSTKSKGSWGSKRDLTAKDFLSIMSAVALNRKKRPNARLLGSSTDEDSEHELAKATNSGEAKGGARGTVPKDEEEDDEEEEDEVKEEQAEREECCVIKSAKQEAEGGCGVLPQVDRGTGRTRVWRGPEDANSIVSGYSTLSTLGCSLTSETHGDEADDEQSELVSETDNESGFASRSLTQERPEKLGKPPRSFLYMHCKPEPAEAAPTSALQTPHTDAPPEGKARSTTPSSSSFSSSSTKHRLHSRPSFSSHRLIQCDTLARKKAKARATNTESSLEPTTEEERTDYRGVAKVPANQEAVPQSLVFNKESQPHAHTHPSHFPDSITANDASITWAEHTEIPKGGSADDLRRVGLRKQLSPETRRKRRAWRRHTVVVGTGGRAAEDKQLDNSPTTQPGKTEQTLSGSLTITTATLRTATSTFHQYL